MTVKQAKYKFSSFSNFSSCTDSRGTCLAEEDLSPNLYKPKPSDFDFLHIFLRNTPLGLDQRWKIIRRNSLEKDFKGTTKGKHNCNACRAGAAGRSAAVSSV